MNKNEIIINVGINYNEKNFILHKLIVKNYDLYIFPTEKPKGTFKKIIKHDTRNPYLKIDLEEITKNKQTYTKEEGIKLSFHEMKRFHAKNHKNKYKSGRYHENLIKPNEINDFYAFCPKNPFIKEEKKRHLNQHRIIINVPKEFDPKKHSLKFVLGVSPINIDEKIFTEHKKVNPEGTRILLPIFNLYLSCKIGDVKNKGLIFLVWHEEKETVNTTTDNT